ncbi:MAG: tetratricopeptide repeat protein [Marinifilaceae bacterium]|nr:tetratricopeptide repeat protein [Marinifilaceae bacterium]
MYGRVLYIVLAMLLLPVALYAQEERKYVRKGNKIYEGGDYDAASTEYLRAMELNGDSFEAAFNLGDAYFKKENYDKALEQFGELVKREGLTSEQLGAAWYNYGNACMMSNKLDEAIEAYKNSLRARPDAMDAKYNLEYAKRKKQEQENQQNQDQNQQNQQNQQGNNQQNQENQNQDGQQDKQDQNGQNQDNDKNDDGDNQNSDNQQNQDDQNQDNQNNQQDNQDKEQNQNEQEQNGDQQNQDNQQGRESESKISKEDAERLLEALEADEQDVRDKVDKEKAKAIKAQQMRIEKDW